MTDAYKDMQDGNRNVLKQFLADIKEAGATGTIELTFEGSGDSGDVDVPTLTDEQQAIVEKLGYAFEYGGGWRWENGQYVETANNRKKTLLSIISEAIPFDWINNEGGHGTVYLDIDAQKVRIEGYQRVESFESNDDEF